MIETTDMAELAQMWLAAKQKEKDATEDRRDIEDHIKKLARISDQLDSTETVGAAGFEIKIEGRIDRKVDSEKLQMLATEAGLSDHLSTLFHWASGRCYYGQAWSSIFQNHPQGVNHGFFIRDF
jgi:hypothetical protein